MKRIAEMKALQEKARFGYVLEISAVDYTKEVNQAGEGIWVVLHLYRAGYYLKNFFIILLITIFN